MSNAAGEYDPVFQDPVRTGPWIECRPDIRQRLKDECILVAGYAFYDIDYSPDRGCLCVFESDRRGNTSIREELRDENNDPRQAHDGDIKRHMERVYGRRKVVDEWLPRFHAKKAELEAKAKADRRDLAHKTTEELVRVVRHGLRTHVLHGESDKMPETGSEKVTVTDRRRVRLED